MHTFLYVSNYEGHSSETLLKSATAITKRCLPSIGRNVWDRYCMLPTLKGGYACLEPECEGRRPMVSEARINPYSVVVFGEVFDPCRPNPAEAVLYAWRSSGAAGVRALEGSFSAVISGLSDGTVTLISDALGQRDLRYTVRGNTLVVSPHDVPIVATGLCPIEIDWTSACSVACFKMSVDGKSLLKGIEACRPHEYYQWSATTGIRRFADPILKMEERIRPDDDKAVKAQLHRIIKNARINASKRLSGESEIQVTLSAGFDSRAIFGLILSVIEPQRIVAITSGEPKSLDSQVARHLAKCYGTNWQPIEEATRTPSPEDFVALCDLKAFCGNGDLTVIDAALKSLPAFEPNPTLVCHGDGGESYRRIYYNPFLPLKPMKLQEALRLIEKRYEPKMAHIRSILMPGELYDAFMDRMRSAVAGLAEISENGYDILDLFFLYGRMCIGRSINRRETWNNAYYAYFSPGLAKDVFMMPAPIKAQALVHRELVRRYAPKAFWLRVNDGLLPPFEKAGKVARMMRVGDREWRRIRKWSRTRYRHHQTGPGGKSNEELRAEMFFGPQKEAVVNMLSTRGGIARKLFGEAAIDNLLEESELNWAERSALLGRLIAMERYRSMVDEAAKAAAEVTVASFVTANGMPQTFPDSEGRQEQLVSGTGERATVCETPSAKSH